MDDYQQLANSINGIAKTNVASGVEPLTIATRRALSGINSNMTLQDMARNNRHRQQMSQFDMQNWHQQNDASPLDFLSMIPGISNIVRGRQQKDQADQIASRYQYGPPSPY